MKEIKLHQKLYDANITYLFGGSIPEVSKFLLEKHGDAGGLEDDTNAYQFHMLSPLGENEVFYVWIHTPNINLLWHETMHLTFDILKHRGVDYSESCEDVFAYLGADIFEMLCKKLKVKIVV